MPKLSPYVLAIALAAPALAAAAMSSGGYSIVQDSLNTGGGLGTSTSYVLESTVGEVATGDSTSTSYSVRAGYQQVDAPSTISVSSPADPSLGSVSGLAGGTAATTVTWTVLTDSSGGYGAYVRADTDPALQGPGGARFEDYAPAGGDPDFTFSIAATDSEFGFSVEGDDVAQRFLDNGSICNSGAGETSDRCYDGFATTDSLVALRGSANAPTGSDVTLRLKAGVGSSKIQDSGSYSATVTFTAYAQ
jgi:hypothetical protein